MSAHGEVVVGYEGGPAGADALAFGVRWCRSSGDDLIVATVHPGAATMGIGRVDAEWVAYERAEAERLLQQARRLVPGDVSARFQRIDAGSAAHGLHEIAEHGETPLVILGTHRGGQMSRTFPGSTGERLLSGSACPVVLVPRGYADAFGTEAFLAPSPQSTLTRVAVAFVDTTEGRVALEHASRIARHISAALLVISVVPDTRVWPSLGEPRLFAQEQRADYQRSLDEAVASVDAGVPTSGMLREGPVGDTLAEIGPHDADLIISGSRGYGPLRRVLLGGVSGRLVRVSQVPVAVIPRGDL